MTDQEETNMERQVELKEISDGKLYGLDDLVRADCAGCAGCSACCRGMGNSIVLDPLDIHRLSAGLSENFETLLKRALELHVVDGMILPNIRMEGAEEACPFLNEEGRCRIHEYRPGICRLFPLGRFYENRSFHYFLQVHECRKPGRAKIRVKKWIDVASPEKYDEFVCRWHYFLKDMTAAVKASQNPQAEKAVNMYVLKKFYFEPYGDGDFYEEFYSRLKKASDLFLAGEQAETGWKSHS